jgi:hypothetical protein
MKNRRIVVWSVLALLLASPVLGDAFTQRINGNTPYPTQPVVLGCVDDSTSPTFVSKPCGNVANPINVTATFSDTQTQTNIGATNSTAAANPSATAGLNGVIKGLWTDTKSLFGTAGTGSAVVLTVQGNASGTPIPVSLSGTLSITANSSVNVSQMNGVATTMGNGISGTGVQRVTIASDSTGVLGISSTANYVGGYEFFVSTTPTIQNASYASGNCMGGFQAVAVARTTGGSGILNKFVIASKGGGTTALTVYVFGSNPSASTCTDKSTFTLNAADISKQICAPFVITPAVPIGTTVSEAENTSMQCHFTTSGNSNIYVGIVSGGTWTPTSTTDIIFNVGGTPD